MHLIMCLSYGFYCQIQYCFVVLEQNQSVNYIYECVWVYNHVGVVLNSAVKLILY